MVIVAVVTEPATPLLLLLLLLLIWGIWIHNGTVSTATTRERRKVVAPDGDQNRLAAANGMGGKDGFNTDRCSL